MSYRRIASALRVRGLKPTEKLVLVYLADSENDRTGVCNPSYSTIGDSVGIDRRQVGRIVDSLVNTHRLISVKRTQKSYLFSFCFEKACSDSRCDMDVACDTDVSCDADVMSRCDMDVASDVTPMSHKPGKNQEDNQEQDKKQYIKNNGSCSCYRDKVISSIAESTCIECGYDREQVASSSEDDSEPLCVDIDHRRLATLNSWDVFWHLKNNYNLIRINHAVVMGRLDQLRANGWTDGNQKKIKYLWRYLKDFALRIKDDPDDVRDFLAKYGTPSRAA